MTLVYTYGYGKFSFRLIGPVMFGVTFDLVTRVGLPSFFGTMKDDSLSINILASNYCLCDRIIFQNGVNSFSKIVNHFLKKFCRKGPNFEYFVPYYFLQISATCGPNIIK